MTLYASEGGSKIPPIDAGVYQGVCYGVVELGHQSVTFEGNTKSVHQAIILWEIPSERLDIERDGKKMNLPRVVSKKYTLSLGDRAILRKDLESWRGKAFTGDELKAFDIHKLIGVNCMIQLIHKDSKGRTFANVSAVLPIYKGMAALRSETEPIIYSLQDGEPPNTLPQWIIDMIHDSAEFVAAKSVDEAPEPPVQDSEMADVPF